MMKKSSIESGHPIYLGTNLQLLRQRRGLSQEEMATTLGIKRASLSGYELGHTQPNLDVLATLADFFSMPLDPLIRLDLSAIPGSQLEAFEKGLSFDADGKRLRVLLTTVDPSGDENIELVPQEASAGYTRGYADPDYIKVLPTFRLPFLPREKKYRTFPIKGDSMPPVQEGSWVTGSYVQNWHQIKDGEPCILVTRDEGIVFKLVANRLSEDGTFLLSSTNPAYEPYRIKATEVVEVWRFVNYISPELPEANLSRDQLAQAVMDLQREVAEIRSRV
ncbi:MAG: helix-turn-helix domain-containing protein [Flavobacteriales bacterium]|nr:helix-turn-helix domain-containing protein [Flavobacteriales bacterium]